MGGRAITYLTNLLLRFDDNSKLKGEEGLGINGSVVDVQIIKSRTGRAGNTCSLVFDFERGFDPELSLYLLLKNKKRINGAGAYLYIGDHTDMKFSQKNLKEKLATDPEFARVFTEEAVSILKTMVTEDVRSVGHSFTISDDIMASLNA